MNAAPSGQPSLLRYQTRALSVGGGDGAAGAPLARRGLDETSAAAPAALNVRLRRLFLPASSTTNTAGP
jgi:hypothetical protein